MLTSLQFLTPGQVWPPKSERPRLDGYAANRQLFENDHGQAFRAAFTRIERRRAGLGVQGEPIRHELVVSFPKRISVATASLLFGEPVGIVAGTENDTAAMEEAEAISERSRLGETLVSSAIDVSRYGDGVFLIHRDEDTSEGVIDLSRPDVWFPVVDARNLRRVLYHVLATPYRRKTSTGDPTPDTLHVEIHERGWVTIRDYELNNWTLGRPLDEEKRQATGLSDFAVLPVHMSNTEMRPCETRADTEENFRRVNARLAALETADTTTEGALDALDTRLDTLEAADADAPAESPAE